MASRSPRTAILKCSFPISHYLCTSTSLPYPVSLQDGFTAGHTAGPLVPGDGLIRSLWEAGLCTETSPCIHGDRCHKKIQVLPPGTYSSEGWEIAKQPRACGGWEGVPVQQPHPKKEGSSEIGRMETEVIQMTALQIMWPFFKAWQINVNSQLWTLVDLPGKDSPQ